MGFFSLQTKFTAAAFAAVVGVGVLSYTGYSAVNRLLKLTELEIVTNVIRHHMELDMMHDGVRGDVYVGVMAFESQKINEIEKARKDLEEHIDIINEHFDALKSIELPDEIADSYKVITPAFEEYTKHASNVLDKMKSDIVMGTRHYADSIAEFEEQFEALEGIMAQTSDNVQSWSSSIKEEGIHSAEVVRQQITVVLIISLALALFVPVYARCSLFRSLSNLQDVANKLSKEEYDIEVAYTSRSDEIGQLARVLDSLRATAARVFILKNMVDNMPINIITADKSDKFEIRYMNNAALTTLRTLQEHLPCPVDALLGQSIDIFHKDPQRVRRLLSDASNLPHYARVKLGPETIQQTVSAMYNSKGRHVGAMLAWTIITENDRLANTFEQSIGTVSDQISSSADSLNQGATVLQSSIEQLSASASEISQRVHDAMNVVHTAAAKGEEAQVSMQRLSVAAENVAGVISLIQQIAEKINLLALNATIESARAGEAGKGFAVVANEVKNLATQTSNAITEISAQVSEMHDSADQAVSIVKEMSQTMQSVNVFANDVAASVEQQQASTAEIAKNICGSSALSGVCDRSSVLGLAAQLASVSAELKNECTIFLETVRKM